MKTSTLHELVYQADILGNMPMSVRTGVSKAPKSRIGSHDSWGWYTLCDEDRHHPELLLRMAAHPRAPLPRGGVVGRLQPFQLFCNIVTKHYTMPVTMLTGASESFLACAFLLHGPKLGVAISQDTTRRVSLAARSAVSLSGSLQRQKPLNR